MKEAERIALQASMTPEQRILDRANKKIAAVQKRKERETFLENAKQRLQLANYYGS
jgi:hypothetical protein